MANTKKAVIGYVIGLLLIIGLFFYIGIDKVAYTLSQFQIIYLAPTVILFLAVIGLNALNLKVMYLPVADIPYFTLLKKYTVSWSLGTILPSRVGEFSLAYFLKDRVPIGKSTAILVLDKLVSLAVFSFFSILGMLYFFGFREAFQLFLVLATLGILIFFIFWSEKIRMLAKRTVFSKVKHHFTGFSKTFRTYLKNEKKIIFANFCFTLMRLFLQAALLSFLLAGFGATVNLFLLVYVISITTILGLLPFTPNGLGIREVSLVFFITILGISTAKAAGTTVISFLIEYCFAIAAVIFFGMHKAKSTIKEKKYQTFDKIKNFKQYKKQKLKLMLSCGVITSSKQKIKPILEIEEFRDGKLVGICGLVKRHLIFPTLFLAVDEKYRNQGIGTKLVRELLNRKKGIIFLTVAKDNIPAKKIYKKCGFKKIMPWRRIRGKPHELMIHF